VLFGKDIPTFCYQSKSPDAEVTSAECFLRFTNTDATVSFPARVVSKLPNNMCGILLGQIGLIDSLQVEQIPRVLLEAGGQAVGEDI